MHYHCGVKSCSRRFLLQMLSLSWLILIYSGSLKAQTWQVREIGKKEGLPSGGVHWIVPDNQGFLWMLSDRGLLKWDGNRFENIPIPGSRADAKFSSDFRAQYAGKKLIIHNYKIWFEVDSNGNLCQTRLRNYLFANQGPGIPFSDHLLSKNDILRSKMQHLLQDLKRCNSFKLKDGSYILTDGLYCLKFTGNKIYSLHATEGSCLYLSVNGNLLCLDGKGNLFKERNGVFSLMKGKHPWRWKPEQENPVIFRQLQTEAKQTYALLREHLFTLRLHEQRLLIDTLYSGIEPNASLFWINPQNEHLFLCSRHDGLLIYSPTYFRTEASGGYPGSRVVYNFALHPSGKSIIHNQDLHRLLHPGQEWYWGEINAMLNLSDGRLAAGVRDELVIFDRHLKPTNRYKLKYLWLRNMLELNGKLYFNNNGLGWIDLKSGELTELLDTLPLLSRRLDAFCMAADRRSILMFYGNHLYQYDPESRRSSLYSQQNFHNIKSMMWDSTNSCLQLFSRDHGIYVLTGKDELLSLPLDAQAVISRAHGMIRDQDGDYWIPGDNGLLMMKGKDFRNFLKSKGRKTPEYRYFGSAYGLTDNEFNGGFNKCGMLFKDSIVLANMAGAVWFHPNLKRTRAGNKVAVYLRELILDGKSIALPHKELMLPFDYKTLRIKTAHADFSQQITSLRYRLTGEQQTEWSTLQDNEIMLFNLKPGSYLLEIALSEGEKRQSIKLPIKVKQVWYLQIWAIVLWLAILIAGGYGLFEWRSRGFKLLAEKEVNRSRLALFSIIAHDLRSPVNSFRDVTDNISFLLKQKRYDDIQIIQHELDKANRGLQLMLGNLLHWSLEQQQLIKPDPKPVNLKSLSETHINLDTELAGLKKITIELEGEEVSIPADEKSLALMLRNLLDNAIKYSETGGLISVKTGRKDGRAFLCIENKLASSVNKKSLEHLIQFFHSKESAEPGRHGLGLGAVLIKQAAGMNKIKIEPVWLQSEGIFRLCLFPE